LVRVARMQVRCYFGKGFAKMAASQEWWRFGGF
jgi:hypothetical protein